MYFKRQQILRRPIDGESGFLLLRDDITRMGTVVFYDAPENTIYAAMPGDLTPEGIPYAKTSSAGLDEITSWYDLSWARKVYKRLANGRK